MSRIFAYLRVSTVDQLNENQLAQIKGAGFELKNSAKARRIFEEKVSGSVPALERPVFKQMVERLEDGDVLVVTKLDRLGRSALDVRQTVDLLSAKGVRLHCLQLGGADLTSSAGKLILGVLASMAEFERDLIIERTQAGLQRAKAQGKTLGRPAKVDLPTVAQWRRENAASIAQTARQFSVSTATVKRACQA